MTFATNPEELESIIIQGKDWINGKCVHNQVRDECTPDFSCCDPSLFIQSREERIQAYNEWAAKYGVPLHTDA